MKKKKVFFVDDDRVTLKMLETRLNKAGYEISWADNGQAALEAIPGFAPDAIISDIVMPVMDGYELHRRVRQDPLTAAIPFIFLSVRSEPADQLKGLRMGADDYVTKPFKAGDLLERLEKVLQASEKNRPFRLQADFGGNLAQMGLGDILQIVEMNHKSGVLNITDPQGQNLGQVIFKDGRLIHAESGQLKGEEAFYGLMGEVQGQFEFYVQEATVTATIESNNMAILLEGNRLIDDSRDLYSQLQELDATLKVRSRKIPAEMIALHGNESLHLVLALVEEDKTVRQIVTSGGMSRPRAEVILNALIEGGNLEVRDQPPAPAASQPSAARIWVDPVLLRALQDLEKRELTGVMEIRNRPRQAAIYCRGGRIVHAYHGKVNGKKALFRIFYDRGGSLHFQGLSAVPEPTLSASLDELVEESSQELEWRQRFQERLFDSRVRVDCDSLECFPDSESSARLMTVVGLAQQHSRIGDILDASPLTDMQTFRLLAKLIRLGAISADKQRPLGIHIVTDSTSDLPPDLKQNPNLSVVPLTVKLEGETFIDGVNLHPEGFYQQLRQTSSIPTTSPPSVEDFDAVFHRAAVENKILALFLSAELSQTFQNAVAARDAGREQFLREHPRSQAKNGPPRIELVDSRLVSTALGLLVLEALDRIEEGWPLDKIRTHVERIVPTVRSFFMVDTLEYLQRGGKIGRVGAAMDNLKGNKPILGIRQGVVDLVDRVQSGPELQARVEKLIREDLERWPGVPIQVAVMHADAPRWAEQMSELMTSRFNCERIIRAQIGPTVGIHCGPGTVAVAYFPVND